MELSCIGNTLLVEVIYALLIENKRYQTAHKYILDNRQIEASTVLADLDYTTK